MSLIIPPFSTTGIGSVPHTNAKEACELIAGSFDIPFWPQLPRRSFRELMIPQYAEGLPFLRIDDSAEKIYIDKNDSDDLDRFYETHAESPAVAISEEHSAGAHEFIRAFADKRLSLAKGQVTGPLTFSLGVKNASGAPIYFDEEMREISSMLLQAKIRWQVNFMKKVASNVIIFIDEPIFSAIGSPSYLGVSEDETLRLLSDSASAIKLAGGVPGIHCCGKANWRMVMQSGLEILNFDAFDYFETFAMYGEDIRNFLEAGGYIAWGIVPTSEAIADVTADHIATLFKERLSKLHDIAKSDLIYSRSLITPSCGAGARSLAETEKIFSICRAVKESALS